MESTVVRNPFESVGPSKSVLVYTLQSSKYCIVLIEWIPKFQLFYGFSKPSFSESLAVCYDRSCFFRKVFATKLFCHTFCRLAHIRNRNTQSIGTRSVIWQLSGAQHSGVPSQVANSLPLMQRRTLQFTFLVAYRRLGICFLPLLSSNIVSVFF